MVSIFPCALLALLGITVSSASVPIPNARQLAFMEMEFTQFMHFGIPTFWNPPEEYLYEKNPTYHDCTTTDIDHGNQTKGYYPCLNPDVFHPTALDADDWMEASVAMGMKEICITAKHEGGFALWPSKFTNYSVATSSWRGGKGDVLREFADAANRWGVNICYYQNVQADGYQVKVAGASPELFIERQVAMVKEVLTEYGPVNRYWFDGTQDLPNGTDTDLLWKQVYEAIRTVSPSTIIGPYRGDLCAAPSSLYTYTNTAAPNSTDIRECPDEPVEGGTVFKPNEMHGITIQEGPDGNSDKSPTYWFWHPWACALNVTGCPWVGHGNASRVFDSYIKTVGHGGTLNMNIPPDRTGTMNHSVKEVMFQVGAAINSTFHENVGRVVDQTGPCTEGLAQIEVPPLTQFDYVMTMEDLSKGQRIANYSVEYQAVGSGVWQVLVPVCDLLANGTAVCRSGVGPTQASPVEDRPDGNDPRDQYIGHKRIDTPIVTTVGPSAETVAKVRFNCYRALAEPVTLRSFSLHLRTVPWTE